MPEFLGAKPQQIGQEPNDIPLRRETANQAQVRFGADNAASNRRNGS